MGQSGSQLTGILQGSNKWLCKAHRPCMWRRLICFFWEEAIPMLIWGLCFGSLHVVTETWATSVSWVYQAVEKRQELNSSVLNINSPQLLEGAHHSTVWFSSSAHDPFLVPFLSFCTSESSFSWELGRGMCIWDLGWFFSRLVCGPCTYSGTPSFWTHWDSASMNS